MRNIITKVIFTVCLNIVLSLSLQGQYIVSVNKVSSFTLADIQQISGLITPVFPVDFYYVAYNTIDPHGNPTVASGGLFVPIGCDSLPLTSYQHGTTLNRDNVPSRGDQVAVITASLGYAISASDFLGLGDNFLPHPYIHAESQATASIDMMRAAREYLTDSLVLAMNDQVFLVGYSQGGHATMATHKYIEDNNLLGEFNVLASAPLSGPYNMSGVQMQIPSDSLYANPSYLPYLTTGYQYVYGNLYTSLDQYYKPPYDTIIPQYLDGSYNAGDLDAILPNNVYDFMQDSVLQNFTTQSDHPLQKAIRDNDNYDWLPTRPIQMVYCDGDEQVFYQNTITAEAAMLANGATNVASVHAFPGADHAGCAPFAFLQALAFIQNYSDVCVNTVSTNRIDQSYKVIAFPNPTHDIVQLNLGQLEMYSDMQLEVINTTGQKVLQQTISPVYQHNISMEAFGHGVFFIRLYNDDFQVIKRVIVY